MHDDATIAGLFALALGLVKLLEVMASWVSSKLKGNSDSTIIVKLDPEASRMIRENNENVKELKSIVSVKDSDGTPMVYALRSTGEDIRDVANCIRDISNVQERIVENLDRLEDRIEENNRQIAKIASRG